MEPPNEAVLDEHLAAENAHDLERIMATYGESPTVVLNGQRIEGREAVRRFHSAFGFSGTDAGSFSHVHVAERRRHHANNAIIVELTLSGRHTGVWQEVVPTGQRFEVAVCAVYGFDARGLLESETVYFDSGWLRRQLARTTQTPVVAEYRARETLGRGPCGTARALDLEHIIRGRYRIQETLRQSGVHTVFKARDLLLNQTVAIKIVEPEAVGNDSFDCLVREALLVAHIRSEHVLRAIDQGIAENGALFVVTPFLEGRDLDSWLQEQGPLPVEQAVDFVIQACDAMAEAHSLGIVHRDLKPANLFAVEALGLEPFIKILDFALATTFSERRPLDDDRQEVLGTLVYMAPEQIRSAGAVDQRADIWSLGVTLHELVTGKLPYEGTSTRQLFSTIASDEPLRLPETSRALPAALVAVMLNCLQKDPGDRYQNVAELVAALHRFAPERSKPLVERISTYRTDDRSRRD